MTEDMRTTHEDDYRAGIDAWRKGEVHPDPQDFESADALRYFEAGFVAEATRANVSNTAVTRKARELAWMLTGGDERYDATLDAILDIADERDYGLAPEAPEVRITEVDLAEGVWVERTDGTASYLVAYVEELEDLARAFGAPARAEGEHPTARFAGLVGRTARFHALSGSEPA